MTDTALLFDRPAPASTALVFGDEVVAPLNSITITGAFPVPVLQVRMYPPVEVGITGTFPAPALLVKLIPHALVSITGAFPRLQALAEVTYHTNTQRPTVAQVLDKVQVAAPVEWGINQPQQHAQANNTGAQGTFTEARRLNAGSTTGFDNARRTPNVIRTGFDDAAAVRDATTGKMQEGDRQWLKFFSQFQEADRLAAARLAGVMQDGIRNYTAPLRGLFQEARKRDAVKYTGRAKPGVPTQRTWWAEFQEAQVPPAGVSPDPVVPPVIPPYWGTALVFGCPPGTAALVFAHYPCGAFDPTAPPALLQILPARFFMSAHTVYAQRLPDLADVPIFDATVSADSGSYCWSLSASGPAELFELLAPVDGLPAQIKVMLDGIPWVFAVDSLSRSTTFGQSSVRVQGRSLTALIAAPYLRAATRGNEFDRTAQQLAEDALAGTGITLDWGIGAGALSNGGMIDWLVPAGAYSHQGTPLDAVQAIVQAAGGYLQSHRSLPTLQARHPYGQRVGDTSGAPWAWATGAADVELAPDALITSSIARQDGAHVNAVYVSGTTAGVLAIVKRSGTAGDALAAMVTDPLITHADAARQRGLSILGAAGHKYAVSLELPVLTGAGQPGVLDVGQLVQVNAAQPWRARVRSVSAQYKFPTLRQTVTLERHLESV